MTPGRAVAAGWFAVDRVQPLGRGHINDTYLVENARGRYVLQRLNRVVFPQPETVMSNYRRVAAHIDAQVAGWVPVPVTGIGGGFWFTDDAGDVWRLVSYIGPSRTLEEVDATQARAAGFAFGRYQALLEGLPGPRLRDPIEGFLRLATYLQRWRVVAGGPGTRGRAARRSTEAAFIDARAWLADHFTRPGGYIHGDCKINNLLFHPVRDEVVGVVDLDTTMWGHWAWDLGDLVRSAAVSDGAFSVRLYEAVLGGYLVACTVAPSAEALVLAPRYLALSLGVRFLTDHYEGDRYFKVARAGDNLIRARAQLSLLETIEAAEDQMWRVAQQALTDCSS